MRLITILAFSLLALFGCNNSDPGSAETGNTGNTVTTPSNTINTSSSANRPPSESPEIHVQVNGLQGGKAYLVGIFADQQYGIDSAQIDGAGRMLFKRAEPYKSGFVFVWLQPTQESIQMIIDSDQTFSMTTNSGSIIQSMQVSGSKDNELLFKHLNQQMVSQPQIDALNKQMQALQEGSLNYNNLKTQRDALIEERQSGLKADFEAHPELFYTKFKFAGQNPELVEKKLPDGTIDKEHQIYMFRSQFWDNVDLSDERLLYTPVLANKLKRYINELTPQHQDSIIKSAKYVVDRSLASPETFKFFSNWIALNYEPEKTTLMDPEAVHVFMVQNYFTNERAFWADSLEVYALQKRAGEMASSLLNKQGPNVTANDPQGVSRSIYDSKKPFVVVFMFNPDCDHCREEAPQLKGFYYQWQDQVDIFTIALDTNDQEWRQFLQSYSMPGTHVYDPTNKAIYAKYYVDNTPEIYILDSDRKIVAKNLKVKQIGEVLQREIDK
ncbi:MAG: thioredoxin-like domain-containing protein [Bacteroidota bacterium]